MQKYTAKYFREMLPDWKKKRDPITIRFFYRPLSFPVSAFFANLGFTANDVTLLSIVVAVIADALIAVAGDNRGIGLAGAILISIWLLLDCTDGNMARSIRKQPYGEFLDALGSYVLVAFLGISCGCYVYYNGGVIFDAGEIQSIICGGLLSVFDLLMRAAHQKFVNTEVGYRGNTQEKSNGEKVDFFSRVKERAMLELGIGGILPPVFVLCMATNAIDIVMIYMFIYNFAACMVMVMLYIFRAMKKRKISLDEFLGK